MGDDKPRKLNREQRRQLSKDLRRETVRATMPDMTKDYRAKRKAAKKRADVTRNKNRRLAKR